MDKKLLNEYGVNCSAGLERCMNDEDMYFSLLRMFLKDTTLDRASKAFEAKDCRALFSAMHELKGVSGNVGLDQLYAQVCPLVDALRGGQWSNSVKPMFKKVAALYKNAKKGILKADEQ